MPNILICDDDKDIVNALKIYLSDPDYTLYEAFNGREALNVLAGTRVYLTLEAQNGNAVFCFKNTSKEALDMSADELTERFTRGDSSRNTEGNGLGLSIAKSLTELQKGSMQVVIDGDLFKVTLSFPIL